MAQDSPIPHYPMFLDLSGRTVVIVGGGEAAQRRASAFLRYGADVVVIASEASESLRQMEADGLIAVEQREYGSGDLEGVALVACADVPDEVSRRVYRDADLRGCPANTPGIPERCNYLVPTSLRRGPLQIAITTRGAAPTVARRLRDELKERYGEEWGDYVTLLGSVRSLAQERIADPGERDQVLRAVAEADLLTRIAAGEALSAEQILLEFEPLADDASAQPSEDGE